MTNENTSQTGQYHKHYYPRDKLPHSRLQINNELFRPLILQKSRLRELSQICWSGVKDSLHLAVG